MATALPEQAPGVAPQVAELRIICRLLRFCLLTRQWTFSEFCLRLRH